MAMVVKHNMSALSALNTLNTNTNALSKSLKKVSSGMKINSAADDASGYAISEKMRVNIRSLDQANANAQNGNSMMKVAEGAVSSTVEILKTLKEKAVNAANDTNTDADRATIQKELDQSIDQINDNANVTFNGQYLVDGSKSSKTTATTTVMTNVALSKTNSGATALTDLQTRAGVNLNIHDTDSITVSYVKDGKTVTSSAVINTFKINEDAMSVKYTDNTGNEAEATSVDGLIALADSSGDDAVTISYLDADNKVQTVTTSQAKATALAAGDAKGKVTSVTINKVDTAQVDPDAEQKLSATGATLSNVIATLTDKEITVTKDTAEEASSFIGVDGAGNTVYTADKDGGISLTASHSGISNQIAGFTIYVTDNKGNVNKSANAVLDTFDESIRAVNESADDNSVVLQIGTKAGQSIKVGLTDMKATALGLQGNDGTTISVSTQANANAAINAFDSAIAKALDQQTTLGSVMSRLEYTQSNLTTASENVTAAESTIRDADMAKEMTEYTKNNVLMQAAQSMLSQANQSSSNALSLLQ